jgi:hypothetical protein
MMWILVFVGLGAGLGEASGGSIGAWCGGILGLALLVLLCMRYSRQLSRRLRPENEGSKSSANFKRYRFDSSWEGDGQVFDENDKLLWRHKSIGGNIFRSSVYGFFWLPPYAVQDMEGNELLRFERIKRIPRTAFEIREGNHVVGTIHKRSSLFTEYRLELESGLRCSFLVPPFTVWFHGIVDGGGRILIRLWHHRVWLAQLDSSINDFYLVAAIALIHRERLRNG